MREVAYLPEAVHGRAGLPARDRVAVDNAVAKLEAMGPALPYPHSSNVEGWNDLRELRPQAGKSLWRRLYRKVGDRKRTTASRKQTKARTNGNSTTRHAARTQKLKKQKASN